MSSNIVCELDELPPSEILKRPDVLIMDLIAIPCIITGVGFIVDFFFYDQIMSLIPMVKWNDYFLEQEIVNKIYGDYHRPMTVGLFNLLSFLASVGRYNTPGIGRLFTVVSRIIKADGVRDKTAKKLFAKSISKFPPKYSPDSMQVSKLKSPDRIPIDERNAIAEYESSMNNVRREIGRILNSDMIMNPYFREWICNRYNLDPQINRKSVNELVRTFTIAVIQDGFQTRDQKLDSWFSKLVTSNEVFKKAKADVSAYKKIYSKYSGIPGREVVLGHRKRLIEDIDTDRREGKKPERYADYAPFYLPDSIRFRHTLVIGGSGSGKTASVIAPSLVSDTMNREKATFTVNPKADDYLLKAALMSSVNDPDNAPPFGFLSLSRVPTLCYNPLDSGDSDQITKKIIYSGEFKNEYYRATQETWLLALLSVLIHEPFFKGKVGLQHIHFFAIKPSRLRSSIRPEIFRRFRQDNQVELENLSKLDPKDLSGLAAHIGQLIKDESLSHVFKGSNDNNVPDSLLTNYMSAKKSVLELLFSNSEFHALRDEYKDLRVGFDLGKLQEEILKLESELAIKGKDSEMAMLIASKKNQLNASLDGTWDLFVKLNKVIENSMDSVMIERRKALKEAKYLLDRANDLPYLDFRRILNQGGNIYVEVPTGAKGPQARALARMLIMELQILSADRDSGIEPKAISIQVTLDEFASLVYTEFINLIDKCRSARIGLCLAHQSLANLQKDNLSDSFKGEIIDNTASKILLAVADPETQRFCQDVMGQVEVLTRRVGRSKPKAKMFAASSQGPKESDSDQFQIEQRPIIQQSDFATALGQGFVQVKEGDGSSFRGAVSLGFVPESELPPITDCLNFLNKEMANHPKRKYQFLKVIKEQLYDPNEAPFFSVDDIYRVDGLFDGSEDFWSNEIDGSSEPTKDDFLEMNLEKPIRQKPKKLKSDF